MTKEPSDTDDFKAGSTNRQGHKIKNVYLTTNEYVIYRTDLVPYRPNLMIFAQDFFGDFWKPAPPLGFKVIKKSSNFLVPAMPG